MLFLTFIAAAAFAPQSSIDLLIMAISKKRAAFQALKPAEPMFGGDGVTSYFFPAGRADYRYVFGSMIDMGSEVLIKEYDVGGKAKQRWRLKLIEKPDKGKPKPGELNMFLRKRGFVPKGPLSSEIIKDLRSPLPIAAYQPTGPTEILFSHFIIGGVLSVGEPTDTAGESNKTKLKSSYPVSTFEIAWLKAHR